MSEMCIIEERELNAAKKIRPICRLLKPRGFTLAEDDSGVFEYSSYEGVINIQVVVYCRDKNSTSYFNQDSFFVNIRLYTDNGNEKFISSYSCANTTQEQPSMDISASYARANAYIETIRKLYQKI